MAVRRVIHRRNPFVASARADAASARTADDDPERTAFFAAREVLTEDGRFPFGEGFLYAREPRTRDRAWRPGEGAAGTVTVAGHEGTKDEQQDSYGGLTLEVDGVRGAALVVADGVSASQELARPASRTAVKVFLERLDEEVRALSARGMPTGPHRHRALEGVLKRASFAANFEVVRQVLLDKHGETGFSEADRRALKETYGIDLPTGALSVRAMERLAPALDPIVVAEDLQHARAALTTFAAAVAIDSDLYTFSCGDAVIGLYRPESVVGRRFVHLTHRDQEVVELYRRGDDAWMNEDVFENVITESFGGSAVLTGTLRRYPNLLEAGDRVVAASDGIGPRGGGEGLRREAVEVVLELSEAQPAIDLVEAQLLGLDGADYQDNIGVAVLDVE